MRFLENSDTLLRQSSLPPSRYQGTKRMRPIDNTLLLRFFSLEIDSSCCVRSDWGSVTSTLPVRGIQVTRSDNHDVENPVALGDCKQILGSMCPSAFGTATQCVP